MSSGGRQHLVYVRIGHDSAFENWFRPDASRTWDLFLSYYHLPQGPLQSQAEFTSFSGLSKFSALKELYENNRDLFRRYSSIWIVDDDIDLDFPSVDRLFDRIERFGLALAQPSLSQQSHISWDITRNDPSSVLRYTNFVEVMMPAFSQAGFQRCIDSFDQSISSWGLDFVWPKLLGYPQDAIGILDCVVATHTQKVDLQDGAFYNYLANIGINAEKEFEDVIQRYGLQGDIQPRVLAKISNEVAAPNQASSLQVSETVAVPKGEQHLPDSSIPAAPPGAVSTENSSLIDLAIKHSVDKWGEHWYAAHYEHHFAPLRYQPIRLLEIGIGGYEDPLRGGQSLRMWAEYFPNALIYGLDLYDKSAHAEDRIRIRRGSQDDPEDLKAVADEVTSGFDIIVDDGSHINRHIIKSFVTLFPLLNEGGLYAIEDLQTSYWPGFGGSSDDLNTPRSALGFFKNLIDCLNHEEIIRPGYQPSYFDKHIVELHFYHNLLIIKKGLNDEGSNRLKKNVPTSAEPETVLEPAAASDDFDPEAYLNLRA